MSNPKSYYNQTEYENARPSSSRSDLTHKPDDTSSDAPPPPYSPLASGSTLDRDAAEQQRRYGSTRAQHDIIEANDPAYSPHQSLHNQKYLPMHLVPPVSPQSLPPLPPPLPQQQQQPLQPQPWSNPHVPSSWANGNDTFHRRRRDPGCCKNWCKYICLAFLIWIVILKYGSWFKFSLDTPSQCNTIDTAIVWDQLPATIDFEKNLQVSVEGHVTGGQVRVHRLTNENPGQIKSIIRVAPSSLAQNIDYALEQGEDTRLTLKMPTRPLPRDGCLEIEMDIYLPKEVSDLRLALTQMSVEIMDTLNDVDLVDIKTVNAAIKWDSGSAWDGDKLRLETKNADILASGPLLSDDTVIIKTHNGAIVLGDVRAEHEIDLSTNNGRINVHNAESDDRIQILTSNAPIEINSAQAKQVVLTSSNGQIRANGLDARSLAVTTSNGKVDCLIHGEKDANINVKTSNAKVAVRMSTRFEGDFSVSTSSSSSAIIDDVLPDRIQYTTHKSYLKSGKRSDGNGELTVATSNAKAILSFNA